jgi:1,4-dihydroxy-2-naphthoyl-CoA hydrolase
VDTSAPVSSEREQQIIAMFNDPDNQTLTGRMDIRIVSASRERVVGTMPVEGNTQPYGLLHGGASCVLAETLGSLGSALQAGPGRVTIGIEINATHHRAARTGLVTGVATLIHGGRTLSTFDVVITDADARRVCTARLTCLHRDAVPGGEAGASPA